MKKKVSGAEKVKRTPHLLPESSWCVEPEWSPLLSVAQTPALDGKWQHTRANTHTHAHTPEAHPTKRRGTNKQKPDGYEKQKTAHKGLGRETKTREKKMHANHETTKRMQQRAVVKLATWRVCLSVRFRTNLDGSSDSKRKFKSTEHAQAYLGAVWQRSFLSYKELNQLVSSHSMDSHCLDWNLTNWTVTNQNSMFYVRR